MNRKKILSIIGYGALGIIVLLGTVTVIHIATAKPVVYDGATMQVSSIVFKDSITQEQAKEIREDMKTIAGVENDVTISGKAVVFFHDNRIVDSKKVYDQLMTKGNYQAKRFIVPASLANKKVCPMNAGGFGQMLSMEIKRIFN